MMIKTCRLSPYAFLGLALALGSALAQRPNYPPVMENAKAEVYKTIGETKLKLYIYYPAGHKPSDRRPAIIFFFGGGWVGGTPRHFEKQSRYLASPGMVAVTADYRVLSRHGTKAESAVPDAKAAIRWVRKNAARLGIDPDRIAAGGGSAGGHLAAATATLPGFEEEPGEDISVGPSVSSVPNALALFNPVVMTAPEEGKIEFSEKLRGIFRERFAGDPKAISPYHHVGKSMPLTIIFHGKADSTVPYKSAELFCQKMKSLGNQCELVGYEGKEHGFFNRGDEYTDTLRRTDEFLTSLGYLEGKSMIPAEE